MATCTAAPLERPKDVTEAERGPELGSVPKTTVRDVVEADEMLPTVPLLSVTTLPAAVGSKFAPEITSVAEMLDRVAELGETEGGTRTVATTTAVPLDRPKDVTEAERAPALGCAEKVTVKDVEDAAVTVPMAPLPRVTTLPAAVGSKFAPEITSVDEVLDRVAVLGVTTGAGGAVVGGGVGGLVGVGTGVGAPPPPSCGAMTSPSCGVCGTPVAGSIGSEASAAAATVMLPAERPVPGSAADRLLLLLLPPEAPPAATEGRGAHPTPSLVTTKSPLLGNRSTAFPPALPQVYETGFAVALALRSKTRRPMKAPS
jgi:hypothetical protein